MSCSGDAVYDKSSLAFSEVLVAIVSQTNAAYMRFSASSWRPICHSKSQQQPPKATNVLFSCLFKQHGPLRIPQLTSWKPKLLSLLSLKRRRSPGWQLRVVTPGSEKAGTYSIRSNSLVLLGVFGMSCTLPIFRCIAHSVFQHNPCPF